jgi:UDP-N-acetylmuramoylalanine--D-glutamate ligase
MPVAEFAGKQVVVLGLARQGVALVRYLSARNARVTVSDLKPASELQAEIRALEGLPVQYRLGGHPLEMLEHVDVICLSGGIPLDLPIVAEARRKGIPLTNDTQLFLEAAPARTIGITGSAGKTTTTTLVGRMALAAADAGGVRRAWIGGNIGNPLLGDLPRMRADDLAVLELSSFQLELVTRSPQVAAILNITPNHLDRHHTMQAYREAKARILDFQTDQDAAVLGWDSPDAREMADRVRGRCFFFGLGPKAWRGDGAWRDEGWIVVEQAGRAERVMPAEKVALRGEHNLSNAIAACAIGMAAGLDSGAMNKAVGGFRGVAHRLEFVARRLGADWYNDSIATTPERAVAAIRSFREPIVLLAGGRDKKLPWGEWARLVRERVDHLVLFGEAAELIARALDGTKPGPRPYSTSRTGTLAEAVGRAAQLAKPGDVVLLAPGGTSYDAFRDFEERGEAFRALVTALDTGDRTA